MAASKPEIRIGIPTIPLESVRWWAILFSVGTVYLTGANTLSQTLRLENPTWLEIQRIATAEFLQAGGASIIGAAIIVEVFRMIFAVLAELRAIRKGEEIGEKRGEERGEERGIAIGEERGEERGIAIGEERGEERGIAIGEKRGFAAANARWEGWWQRRQEAEQRGEPFDEPPPSANHRNGAADAP